MGSELEQRITELEIKASFTEDLIDKLDLVITRQQDSIDSLMRQVRDLREQLDNAQQHAQVPHALPPHY